MLYSHLEVFFPGFVLLISSVTKRRNRSKHKINLLTNNHPSSFQKPIYHLKEFLVRLQQIQHFDRLKILATVAVWLTPKEIIMQRFR